MVNEERRQYDVSASFNVPDNVWITFGLGDDEDIQEYSSDPLRSRLKYSFIILNPVLPTIKLNAFSFTNEKGESIPYILYYRTDGRIVHVIDSLPAIFTNDIKQNMKNRSFQIFAECSQSYNETKTIYINYDIEVGTEHFVKQIKYREKTFFDWRPQF